MVNTPGQKSKAIKILGERLGVNFAIILKSMYNPLITILRQVMKWRL